MIRRWLVLRGIRDKLIAAFSLLIASIALFFIAFFPARFEQQAMRATVAKAQAICDMTAYSLEAALHFGDTVAAREVISEIAQRQQLRFLVVRDSAGRQVAARGLTPLFEKELTSTSRSHISTDGASYISTVPVWRDGLRLGSLTVGISLAELRSEVRAVKQQAFLVGFLIFVVGLLLVFAISALVTRPLTAVSKTVHRIAAGDLSLRAEETSDIEVAQLVRAFNEMVDSLVSAQDDLASTNHRLEELVDTRTAKLRRSIHKHRRARKALVLSEGQAQTSSEVMRSLIDLAPQAIMAVNLQWQVTWWNRAAEKLFGWSSGEVLGKPLPFVPPDQQADFNTRRKQFDIGETPRIAEVIRCHKDGRRIPILYSMGILRDPDHAPSGYIAFATDLTERKSLENQLLQAQKMDAVGRLAGGVAHDFNNMLTVILGCSAILESAPLADEYQEEVAQISGAAGRAARLTRQLLTFSRQQVEQPKLVSLGEIVRKLEPMLRRLTVDKVSLTVDIEETAAILADPGQLEQVLTNLVVNAIDATPSGGSIKVSVQNAIVRAESGAEVNAGRYVLMTVSDTGTGMDAIILERIFEPFFTTKSLDAGTGLGLATSYAIASRIGGHIRVSSDPGSGSSFRVYIPHADVTAEHAQEASHVPPPSIAAGLTVLLVEDEQCVRQVIRRTLKHLGHHVLEAENGRAALELAAAHAATIDIVLTDVMMPEMNGRELATELEERYPALRVIFMSGYADAAPNGEGIAGPANAFLQKPFSVAQIIAAIKQVTEIAAP